MRSALLLFSVGVCSALLLPRTAPAGQRTTIRMSASGSTADYLASTIGPRAAVRLAEGDDAIAGLQAEFEEAAAAGAAALEEAAEALEDAADLEDTAMELDAEPATGAQATRAKQVRGASFRALKALVEAQDPQLLRTGLAESGIPLGVTEGQRAIAELGCSLQRAALLSRVSVWVRYRPTLGQNAAL